MNDRYLDFLNLLPKFYFFDLCFENIKFSFELIFRTNLSTLFFEHFYSPQPIILRPSGCHGEMVCFENLSPLQAEALNV